jgi:hypothetical protein
MLALAMRLLPLVLLWGAKSRDPFATCFAGHSTTRARRRDPRETLAPQAVCATAGRVFIWP